MDQEDEVVSVLFPDLSEFEGGEEPSEPEGPPPLSAWAKAKIGTFQSRLETAISVRESKGQMKYGSSSVPTALLVNLVNESFGFNGWSSLVVSTLTVHENFDEEKSQYSMRQRAMVRITLRDGTYIDAEGVGDTMNLPHKHMCHGTTKKMAVTNGLRQAIFKFADLL